MKVRRIGREMVSRVKENNPLDTQKTVSRDFVEASKFHNLFFTS